MRLLAIICLFAASGVACLAQPASTPAQNIAVLVNGESITIHDIIQRVLHRNMTGPMDRANSFVDRVNTVLTTNRGVQEKFKQKMDAMHPANPAEIQKAAERVKKELIEDAMWQVLSADQATKDSVIEALIADRLKLQAAKRFGIEITDEEVDKSIIVDRLAAGELYGGILPDMHAFYARKAEYGIDRRTVREIMRAELAWRAVMNRVYGAATGWEKDSAYDGFSRGYLAKLRQHAMVEHKEQEVTGAGGTDTSLTLDLLSRIAR